MGNIICLCSILGGLYVIIAITISPFDVVPTPNRYRYGHIIHLVPDHLTYRNDSILNIGPYRLCQQTASDIMDLYRYTKNLLDNENIQFWATKSTLLGTIQYSGLCPRSDTLHLCINHRDLSKMVMLRSKSTGHYMIHHTSSGYRIITNNSLQYPFILITLTKNHNGEELICTPLNEVGDCTFNDTYHRRQEVFEANDIFPLREHVFEDTTIYIPQNTIRCLDVHYGIQWLTYRPRFTWCQHVYNHKLRTLPLRIRDYLRIF